MEVRVGPRSFKSVLPMGYVSGHVADQIDDAAQGRLGKQIVNFDVRISRENAYGEAYYERAYVVNGMSRFKRYGLLDLIMYKIGRLIVRFSRG